MTQLSNQSAVRRNYSLMTAVLCWSGMVVMCSLYVTIPLIFVFAGTFGITTAHAAATAVFFHSALPWDA